MSISSTLIVATAIATFGLSSPAFALGGWDNDTGNLQPSCYDKTGWHIGIPPQQQQVVIREPTKSGGELYAYAGHGRSFSVGDPAAAANPGGMSSEMMKNDWFWGGVNPGQIKWGIIHEPLNFYDASRQRPVAVELSVRRDYQLKADDGFWKLPVAIISNGNTVKNTEYSFLANVFAARGYLVASIQQDNPGDPPLMTIPGEPYVGRTGVYKKGEANILFVLSQLKKQEPDADYDHLTLVGHSNGGDIAMYFAKEHPELVSKVVTLDNLRVPFVENAKMKILSFRSNDPNFKTDPGVLPIAAQAIKNSIDIIRTKFQHTDMSDRGPSSVKKQIQADLDKFLNNAAISVDQASVGSRDAAYCAQRWAYYSPATAKALDDDGEWRYCPAR